MVKYYNNPSGKSDKHAAHMRKQADQEINKQATLEKWFVKMTTPKVSKAKVPLKKKDPRNKCNGGAGRDDNRCVCRGGNGRGIGSVSRSYTGKVDKLQRDKERVNNYYMSKEDKNIN